LNSGGSTSTATGSLRRPPESAPEPPRRPEPQALKAWADELALRHFGASFDGTVAWAPRLRRRAGDYVPARNAIRLSGPYFDRYGTDQARATLLHELCHWWAWRHGGDHRENSRAFRDLLRRTGAPRYAPPPPDDGRSRPTYRYRCPACGRLFVYRRRISGYACSTCCRRHAGGRYDPRFMLVPLRAG
jgi:SprT-like protein